MHTVHAAEEEQLATVGHSSLEGPVTRWITRSTNGSQKGVHHGSRSPGTAAHLANEGEKC